MHLAFYITFVKFGKRTFCPNWEEPNVFEEQIVAFDDIDAPDIERIRSALTEHFS
jgi:hypothetical protein